VGLLTHLVLLQHRSPLGQLPQFNSRPQPSKAVPQVKPRDSQVAGTQLGWQMMLLQVSPLGHVPQQMVPPQPSPVQPQFAPTCAQVEGTQLAE
jgi:hypothetical protein